MVEDGDYTAVLDRFEGDQAVLLLEDGEEVVDQLVVDKEDLPEDGQHQDAIFNVRVLYEELQRIRYDPDATEERKKAAQSRFDRLSRRLNDEE